MKKKPCKLFCCVLLLARIRVDLLICLGLIIKRICCFNAGLYFFKFWVMVELLFGISTFVGKCNFEMKNLER